MEERISPDQDLLPVAIGRPHYTTAAGGHLYYWASEWHLTTIFDTVTNKKTASVGSPDGGEVPLGARLDHDFAVIFTTQHSAVPQSCMGIQSCHAPDHTTIMIHGL